VTGILPWVSGDSHNTDLTGTPSLGAETLSSGKGVAFTMMRRFFSGSFKIARRAPSRLLRRRTSFYGL